MGTVSLLKEIANWHKQWVADLSQQYSQLDRPTLNQIAQALISQSIVWQICHDRGIPPDLRWLQPHFKVEPEQLQLATQRLATLKHSHQISALPIELLGQLHEQFLALHQSTTRKAQGMYYTPVAIVDYIVNATLGLQLQNKTVEDLGNSTLRVLDPACGSGVFLLSAYRYLLNWYQTQYLAKFERYAAYLYPCDNGKWQLTIAAKQQILLQHIFGLDINEDAVDVTKQSLLLQLLEGSIAEKGGRSQSLNPGFNLAILQGNIQWGNALIDLDFYQLNQNISFPVALDPIQVFSWQNSFPKALQSGGFEVIIGNPPWIFTRNAQFSDSIKRYYQTQYFSQLESVQRSKAKQTGKVNLFILFLLKCIRLLHQSGQIGIIVPNTLLRTTVYEAVRKYMLDHCSIEQIVDLGREAFSGVTASSAILMLGKNLEHSTIQFINSIDARAVPQTLSKDNFLRNTSYVFSIFLDQDQSKLFQKISSISAPLKSLTSEIIEGIVCRKDQIKGDRESDRHQKILEGKDINRYCIAFRDRYILFDRQHLHRPRPDYVWNAKEKIILRRIAGGKTALTGVLDTECYYAFASTNNILLKDNQPYNIRYILALLNSKLLNYYYIQNFTNQSSLTVNISRTFLEQLPIRSINFDCPPEKSQHDRLVNQVDALQALHQQLRSTSSGVEQLALQQQVETIDRQIDQWVYELYNLVESDTKKIETF